MISAWCEEDANSGDMRELAAPIDPYANSARLEDRQAGFPAGANGLPGAPHRS